MQNHQADTLCVAWCLICWFALAYKKYGHTCHQMSLLRPGVIKQHKPNQTSHSLTHKRTHLFTHPPMDTFTYSLALTHSPTHNSTTHPPTHLFTHSPTYPPTHGPIHIRTYSHLLTHSLIHSLTWLLHVTAVDVHYTCWPGTPVCTNCGV